MARDRGPDRALRRIDDGAGVLRELRVSVPCGSSSARAWQRGERAPAEEFLRQLSLSDAGTDPGLELVYNEILLREQLGETPREEEYLARFPDLASRLGPLFEVHRALETGGPFDRFAGAGGAETTTDERSGSAHTDPSAAERLAHPGYSLVRRAGPRRSWSRVTGP